MSLGLFFKTVSQVLYGLHRFPILQDLRRRPVALSRNVLEYNRLIPALLGNVEGFVSPVKKDVYGRMIQIFILI